MNAMGDPEMAGILARQYHTIWLTSASEENIRGKREEFNQLIIMNDLYLVFKDPTIRHLHDQHIYYFDRIIDEFPADYKKIITYINECFNYHSPFLVEEKDWTTFLGERFDDNQVPELLRPGLIEYESEAIVLAIDEFLTHQKQPTFQTLVAKQNLRASMLVTVQKHDASISDKQKANELITTLDTEINEIYERMRHEQKKLGNYKGYDALQSAKAKLKVNIANFIE